MASVQQKVDRLVETDPFLARYSADLRRRLERVESTKARLIGSTGSLLDFASGHEHFGLHFRDGGWVFREWAPNATSVHLKGPFSNWSPSPTYELTRGDEGVWELRLPAGALAHGVPYRLEVAWQGGKGDRIPAWARLRDAPAIMGPLQVGV